LKDPALDAESFTHGICREPLDGRPRRCSRRDCVLAARRAHRRASAL